MRNFSTPVAGVKLKQNAWNKLTSNEELEFDHEGTEEEFCGVFQANPGDVCDWLDKGKEDFRYQNLTEEVTQEATGDGLSEDDENEKKDAIWGNFKFSK